MACWLWKLKSSRPMAPWKPFFSCNLRDESTGRKPSYPGSGSYCIRFTSLGVGGLELQQLFCKLEGGSEEKARAVCHCWPSSNHLSFLSDIFCIFINYCCNPYSIICLCEHPMQIASMNKRKQGPRKWAGWNLSPQSLEGIVLLFICTSVHSALSSGGFLWGSFCKGS